MPCSPVNVDRRFCMLHAGFSLGLLLCLEDGGDMLPKRRSTFTELHGVIIRKIQLLI
jgi:hypothetical protein